MQSLNSEETLPAEFTPAGLVGGTVKDVSGDPIRAAYARAMQALDTERMRLVVSAAGKTVHWLAAPAAEFANAPANPATPLALALPGMPGHQGAGIYMVSTVDGRTAAAVFDGEIVRCYVDRPERLQRVLPNDKEIFRPGLSEVAPPWVGMNESAVRAPRRLLLGVIAGAVVLSGALLVAGAVMVISAGKTSSHIQKRIEEHRAELASLAAGSSGNTLAPLAELDRLAAFTLRESNSGRIKLFRFENNQVEWAYLSPVMLGGDQLRELGGDVRVRPVGTEFLVERKGASRAN